MFRAFVVRLRGLSFLLDVLFLPLTLLSALWFRYIKFHGIKKFKFSQSILYRIGVFPIVDHYYEPQFNYVQEKQKLLTFRSLPSINFDSKFQCEFLEKFSFSQELEKFIERMPNKDNHYYFNNGSFNSGDAEFYYSMIRYLKPKKIVEVGSGFSTLVALEAIAANVKEGQKFNTELVCIEPFEMQWLKNLKVELVREKVENTDLKLYASLVQNDILFIDSSHIIRPTGDVCFEFLQILPILKSGVYVHFHDIFTPYHYPYEWLAGENRLWNEQYMLEAFLSNNDSFEIVSMLHYLFRNKYSLLADKFPGVKKYPDKPPGSFWIRKK